MQSHQLHDELPSLIPKGVNKKFGDGCARIAVLANPGNVLVFFFETSEFNSQTFFLVARFFSSHFWFYLS